MIHDVILVKLDNCYFIDKIHGLQRNNNKINEIDIQLKEFRTNVDISCNLKDVKCILRYRKYLTNTVGRTRNEQKILR